MVISSSQITHDEVFPLGTAHTGNGSGSDKILTIDLDHVRIFFYSNVITGQFDQFLFIIFSPFFIGRVIVGGKDFTDQAVLEFSLLFFLPLPVGSTGSVVVSRLVAVIKRQVIRFAFRLCEYLHIVDLSHQGGHGEIG